MLKLAGAMADGTITWMTGPRTIADHIAPRVRAAAEEAGRPAPRIVCGLPVAVTADPDAAREAAARIFEIYGGLPSYRAMLDKEGAAGPADVAVVGDEEVVAAAVGRLAEAGVTDFQASVFGDGEGRARTRQLLCSLG
jgi:alkanesulfonate monooxygenase SsuD/methylene tetrahydromethanopterin reductase-like flavin-dependent oxidoreductase (luciferase family)